jgi:large subunit ribosomal protein L13
MKTYSPTAAELDHRWFVVDAEGVVLGRLASKVNAEKVRLTGKKMEQKQYFRHTGYMGHEKFVPVAKMLKEHPERVIEKAVYGMLPKGTLGRQVLRHKLKVYAGPEHPHQGQSPAPLDLNAPLDLK